MYQNDEVIIQTGFRSCEYEQSPEKAENDLIELKQERGNIFSNLFKRNPFGNKTNVDSSVKTKKD